MERSSMSNVYIFKKSIKFVDGFLDIVYGWDSRIRTYECRIQSPEPYHLAISQ